LNNAIAIDVSARKLAFYNAWNERQQAQLKIDLLAKEQQLQQEELRSSLQQNRFLFISILGIIVTGIVLIRNILLKKRNEAHLREIAENELRIQKLETKRQLGELEMQVLRTQMNPHFIFNSLNSINRFILQSDRLQASEYLTQFSNLVRRILQDSQSKMITMQRELESLELYLSLEALRFDNHFSYSITVDPDLDISTVNVPPLVIQPYTENAVWHGLLHKTEKGILKIEIAPEQGFLLIKISDDGIGRKQAGQLAEQHAGSHKSMGIGITSQRIEMAHDDVRVTSVTINDLIDANGDPCGTQVILKLPLSHD
jgi:LytS/YehU family sensor histidine kinase